MEIEKIEVALAVRSYEITVGVSLLETLPGLLEGLAGERGWMRAAVVTDSNVGPLYLEAVEGGIGKLGLELSSISLKAGERSKSAESAFELMDSLAGMGLERSDLVVALGGGVVGDLTAFAASVFKRGLDVVQIPTTLMAQVDSSIGGKTAVNLSAGKNLAGTFHQPAAVICDVSVLGTLPEREYHSGLAEVAKYWFIEPDAFPASLERSSGALEALEAEELVSVVSRCAGIKARIVSVDEFDRGPRAVLNYGHTLGHALEAATGYKGEYTHGEAVAVGMMFAAIVADEMDVAPPGAVEGHRRMLIELGLPTEPYEPAPPFDLVASHIVQDKKNRGGLNMVLVDESGPYLVEGLDLGRLERCYERLLEGD